MSVPKFNETLESEVITSNFIVNVFVWLLNIITHLYQMSDYWLFQNNCNQYNASILQLCIDKTKIRLKLHSNYPKVKNIFLIKWNRINTSLWARLIIGYKITHLYSFTLYFPSLPFSYKFLMEQLDFVIFDSLHLGYWKTRCKNTRFQRLG